VKSGECEMQQRPEQMDVFAKVFSALKNMGFHRSEVTRVVGELREEHIEPDVEPLVRAALARLSPARV
jgi:Holliday junction resolvasome RuvABC DNA-binding subunit